MFLTSLTLGVTTQSVILLNREKILGLSLFLKAGSALLDESNLICLAQNWGALVSCLLMVLPALVRLSCSLRNDQDHLLHSHQ